MIKGTTAHLKSGGLVWELDRLLSEDASFTREEMNAVVKLHNQLKELRECKVPVGEKGLWQMDSDANVKTAYLAVPFGSLFDWDMPQTWAYFLGRPEAPMSKWNPICHHAQFGESIEAVLKGLPYGISKALLFKIPLSLFGEDIGMMYNDRSSGFYLSWLFQSFPLKLPKHGKVPGAMFDDHMGRLQNAHDILNRYWQGDCRDGSVRKQGFLGFLWEQRRSLLNTAIAAANHNHLQDSRQMLLPANNLSKLVANNKVPRMEISEPQFKLMQECRHFWTDGQLEGDLYRSNLLRCYKE